MVKRMPANDAVKWRISAAPAPGMAGVGGEGGEGETGVTIEARGCRGCECADECCAPLISSLPVQNIEVVMGEAGPQELSMGEKKTNK